MKFYLKYIIILSITYQAYNNFFFILSKSKLLFKFQILTNVVASFDIH